MSFVVAASAGFLSRRRMNSRNGSRPGRQSMPNVRPGVMHARAASGVAAAIVGVNPMRRILLSDLAAGSLPTTHAIPHAIPHEVLSRRPQQLALVNHDRQRAPHARQRRAQFGQGAALQRLGHREA